MKDTQTAKSETAPSTTAEVRRSLKRNRNANTEGILATPSAAPIQPPTSGRHAEPSLDEMGFWDQINSLSDSDWQNHVCYIYRTEPPVKNSGDKAFIEKRSRPFDENDILNAHGSGRYLCILNNTRQRRTIGKMSFTCHRDDMPPRVKLSQLAPNADESWRAWLEEVEARKVQAQTAAAIQQQEPAHGDVATAEAIRQLGDLSKQILEQQAQARTQPHATDKETPVIDPTLATLLSQMASGRDQLAEKLAERSNSPTQTDPLTLLEKAASVLAKLQLLSVAR